MSEARDTTQQALYAAVGVALLMVGQLVASQALRDGFFLSQFEPTALPPMVVSASLLSLFFVLVSSRLFRRRSPASTLPILFGINGALFVCEWALGNAAPRLTAIFLYLHVGALGILVVSGFWSVVNERFDPRAARRLIGRIGGGATLGGVLGGLAVWQGASSFEIPTMILGLGMLNLLCAVGASRIGDGEHSTIPPEEHASTSVLEIMQDTPYLRNIALLVALMAFCQAVYDYVFKATAAAYFETGAELVSFFALFYLGVGVLTFVVQNLVASRSLQAFGLTVNVGSLPGSGAVLGLAALFFPGLTSAIAMRGGIGVAENSLYRSGFELLYTPVLPEKKRPTKPLIDVGGDKVGTAIGGGFAFLIVGVFPEIANPVLVLAGIAASLASLAVTRGLRRGYVYSLATRLRSGTLRADDVSIADATTRLVLSDAVLAARQPETPDELSADSGAAGDGIALVALRARLRNDPLAREEVFEAGRPSERRPFVAAAPRALSLDEVDPLLASIADLRSSDPARVDSALIAHHPLPRELIPYVIPLLGDERVAESAGAVLGRVAPANTGALLDAVLQSRTPLLVRRKLSDILGQLPTQRSVNGLVELLHDANFELRFRAATNLLAIRRSNPAVRVPRDFLFTVVEREAANCRRLWRIEVSLDRRHTRSSEIESTEGRRVAQGMSFVATLLLMLLDPEPLTLAIRGLVSGVAGQRGTALEYLENVLSPALFSELSPLLEDVRLTAGRGLTSRADLLSEIVETGAPGPVDFAALKAHVDAARARSAGLRGDRERTVVGETAE
jgi:hypothetical protein